MELHEAVVVVTGARGTGKTLFASTYLPPGQEGLIFYHDSERSSNRVVQALGEMGTKFGYYGDLQARFSDLPADDDLLHRISGGSLPWVDKTERSAMRRYYEYVLEDLDKNLVQDKYKVYILDTGEKLEAGMRAWGEDNITKFGFRSVREAMKYGKIWSEVLYPLYEQIITAIFSRGVEVIFLCFHLRTPWEGNKPVPGKVEPSGKPLLRRLSSCMFWLTNEPTNADGAPAGLVLKERLGQLTVVDGKWKIRRMIPSRIPHCTWEDIRHYLEVGCDLANPAPGEVMSPGEREMISELLTDKQMALMVADAETERLQKQIEADQWRRASSTPSVDVTAMLGVSKADPTLIAQARGLGLTAGNKEHVRNLMIDDVPSPLRKSMMGKIDRAIEEVLSG
jgi:hypothetical protein